VSAMRPSAPPRPRARACAPPISPRRWLPAKRNALAKFPLTRSRAHGLIAIPDDAPSSPTHPRRRRRRRRRPRPRLPPPLPSDRRRRIPLPTFLLLLLRTPSSKVPSASQRARGRAGWRAKGSHRQPAHSSLPRSRSLPLSRSLAHARRSGAAVANRAAKGRAKELSFPILSFTYTRARVLATGGNRLKPFLAARGKGREGGIVAIVARRASLPRARGRRREPCQTPLGSSSSSGPFNLSQGSSRAAVAVAAVAAVAVCQAQENEILHLARPSR